MNNTVNFYDQNITSLGSATELTLGGINPCTQEALGWRACA